MQYWLPINQLPNSFQRDKLIAVYNGDLSGGTFNCIQYAKSIGKEIIYIHPSIIQLEQNVWSMTND
jgi:hypothetical protein